MGLGKPGTRVQLALGHFPNGWRVDFRGYSDAPTATRAYSHGYRLSNGSLSQAYWLTVPKGAKAGYTYWIDAVHHNGSLVLEVPFQVSTLNASDTTVGAAQTIRLSGVVPVNRGHSKRVIVYKRFTAAGQPSYSGGTVQGQRVDARGLRLLGRQRLLCQVGDAAQDHLLHRMVPKRQCGTLGRLDLGAQGDPALSSQDHHPA